MAFNKNFVVKNGLEVNTNLIVADAFSDKVGIGTTVPQYTLHVTGGGTGGGIGATHINVTGVGTFGSELRVGLGGTIFSVIANPSVGEQFVGIRTANPTYLLDIRSPVSTGQTALYVQGDVRITGDLSADDITFDDATVQNFTITDTLYVGGESGISTFVGFSTFKSNLFVAGVSTFVGTSTFFGDLYVGGDLYINEDITLDTNLNILGIATIGTLDVSGDATIDGILKGQNGNNSLVVGTGLSVYGSSVGVAVTLAGAGGITTTGGDLYVGKDLYVADNVTIQDGLRVSGITTIANSTDSTTFNNGALVIDGGLGVEKSVNIGGNLDVQGSVYIGGTTISLRGTDVFIENKDIVLGYTTSVTPNDNTANHAGIAIASTEGSPLTSFTASGINTLPDTYKQLMWFRSGTLGFSTDTFAFNYGVAIGTTTMASGVRLAVGSNVTVTDTAVNAPAYTISGTQVISSGRELQNIASLDATTTATIEAAIANAPNTFSDLTVTGISTLGVTSATNLTSQQLVVSGIATFQNNVSIADSANLYIGTGNDLRIFHNGANSFIQDNGTGNLFIDASSTYYRAASHLIQNNSSSETLATFTENGSVALYFDNSKTFETTGYGATVYGGLNVSGVSTFQNNVRLGDNDKLYFGDGNDLEIYHDGSDSYIRDVGTGDLKVIGANLTLNSDTVNINNAANTENLIRAFNNGSVELYYDNSKKIETTGGGITVTGVATATGGFNLGISSAGTTITSGPITTLNFVGTGNTFAVNGTTVDISISGSGGGGGGGGVTETKTTVSTTNATGVGSFATATHRSAVITAQISQGTQYQVGSYLMIHDGTTVTVVEKAAVSTGSTMLGTFAGAISGSNAELRVSLANTSSSGIATITTKIDTVTV
jgi:hypothetical protein